MLEWMKREKHALDIAKIGKNDGLWRDSKIPLGIRKYEGKKVKIALEKLGHSTLTYENCACKKD